MTSTLQSERMEDISEEQDARPPKASTSVFASSCFGRKEPKEGTDHTTDAAEQQQQAEASTSKPSSMSWLPASKKKENSTLALPQRVASTRNQYSAAQVSASLGFDLEDLKAHPLFKLIMGSLALLFLFLFCGGIAASQQPWLAQARASSSAYFSAGSVSAGVISCGSTVGFGFYSIGIFSVGVFSVGVFSVGLFSIGFFSFGLAALGHYAIGMWAWGIVVTYFKDGQGIESARQRVLCEAEEEEGKEEEGRACVRNEAAGVHNDEPSAIEISVSSPRPKVQVDGGEGIHSGRQEQIEGKQEHDVEALDELHTKVENAPSTGIPANILKSSKGDCASRMEAFESECGAEAARLVEQLAARHAMIAHGKHPEGPYAFVSEDAWKPLQQRSRDPRGEELIKKLGDLLRRKQVKFEDPLFPASPDALFAEVSTAGEHANAAQTFGKDQDPFLAGERDIEWKRLSEVCDASEKPVTWSGSVDPDKVAQGKLGTCYLLAAVASGALGDTDVPLKDLCIEDYADVGLYGIKFFLNGSWVTVPIDDRIPCTQGSAGKWAPIFAGPKKDSGQREGEMEVWPMIFEKAWAKFHHSYEATAGGHAADTASYLSAGTLRTVDLTQAGNEEWQQLASVLNSCNHNPFAFIACAVREGTDAGDKGLIAGHAYSVLEMQNFDEPESARFVKIRNAWGQDKWNGRFAGSSDDWTPQLKEKLGYEDEEDGSFFMLWEDFVKYFHKVEICDPTALASLSGEGGLVAESECKVQCFSSYWLARKTAGGGLSCKKTFKFNPSVLLTAGEDGPCEITLFQPDVRSTWGFDDRKYDPCSLVVEEDGGNDKQEQLLCHFRQASRQFTLVKGKTYRLTACSKAPGVQGAFWVAVTGQKVKMETVPFTEATGEEADLMMLSMGVNKFSCVVCREELHDRYESGDKGPMCQKCFLSRIEEEGEWEEEGEFEMEE